MRRAGWMAIAAAIVTLTAAGSSSAGSWYSGARAGLSFASIHGDFADQVVDPQYRMGPVLGGTFELQFAPSFSIAVEAMYIQKGMKFENDFRDESGTFLGTFDASEILEYAEVPILLRGTVGQGRFRPYAVAGPTFGFTLAGKLKTEGFGLEQTLTDDMKPLDVGATVGAGIRLITDGPWRVDLEGRYFRSFSDLWDVSNNLESINHGFTLTVAGSR